MDIKYEINEFTELTEKQKEMLLKAANRPKNYDPDNPPLTEEDLKDFKRISEIRKEERRRKTVTLRLSPEAFEAAKKLGKGYTSVLSRILEESLKDPEIIKRNL